MNRWYDKDKEFAESIHKLRDAQEPERDIWVKDIINIIQEHEPESFSVEKQLTFPIKLLRRRWYDSDPYLWLIMNSMEHLKQPTLLKIKLYLNQI